MSIATSIFDHSIAVPPGEDLDPIFKAVPAKWVVYLFADGDDQPIQLLCVRNLRASLKCRLTSDPAAGPSKRFSCRQMVRRVYWQRVDSAFEADWAYFLAAKALYPDRYQHLLGFGPAWFVHVDPEAAFPRFVRTQDLSLSPGLLIGPIEEKQTATKLIEILQDCFDLCRYHNILVQTPHGKACAYKEMGRCPAPCDGSISMDPYRQMIRQSIQAIADPKPFIQLRMSAMNQAAAELRFELAARHKVAAQTAGQLGKGPLSQARPLEQFQFASLQPGPRSGMAKVFLISPKRLELAATILTPVVTSDLVDALRQRLAQTPEDACALNTQQIVALVSHHLLAARQPQGVFLPANQLDQSTFSAALTRLNKQEEAPAPSEGEGVIKQTQAVE